MAKDKREKGFSILCSSENRSGGSILRKNGVWVRLDGGTLCPVQGVLRIGMSLSSQTGQGLGRRRQVEASLRKTFEIAGVKPARRSMFMNPKEISCVFP